MPASAVTVRLVFGTVDNTFPFVDVPETYWAREAIAWAVANNLISGKENNTLDPNGNATRAEVAVILMRVTELNR